MTNTEIPSSPEPEKLQEQLENKSKVPQLAPYQFKKGQSGNPAGRPPGKSLKERARAMLNAMTEEEEQEFLQGIDKKIIWEMAEGKAKQDVEMSGKLSISNVLNELENGGPETPVEGLENPAPIQDQEQATAVSEVQAEPGTGALPPEQVVEEPNPEVPPAGVHN